MLSNIHHIDCNMTDYFCDGTRFLPNGSQINHGTPSESWEVCGRMCFKTSICNKWHFFNKTCFMYKECTFTRDVGKGNVAGTKECPGGKIQMVIVDF